MIILYSVVAVLERAPSSGATDRNVLNLFRCRYRNPLAAGEGPRKVQVCVGHGDPDVRSITDLCGLEALASRVQQRAAELIPDQLIVSALLTLHRRAEPVARSMPRRSLSRVRRRKSHAGYSVVGDNTTVPTMTAGPLLGRGSGTSSRCVPATSGRLR